ncbi:hypothetical protein HGRIS_006311 [Hohenbuehelia grisea]|uniref:Cyclin-like domain-containing protein n=1 Tax=Hohenbuehelia grisea TaxID=104357 RepID=A0ABR3JZH0_9AGAR
MASVNSTYTIVARLEPGHLQDAIGRVFLVDLSQLLARTMDYGRHSSASQSGPASSSKFHHPYFTPAEVDYLSAKQRGKLSATQEDKVRQTACSFIESMSARIGFPRRTIATAQNLYHRFHLFFPRKDFNYVDVAHAALFVSTKMHDTLKKPRELLAVSYALRYPDLVAKSKNPGGEVDIDIVDPQVVENDRQRLLAVERLILEAICFNFTSRMPFPYVIKLGKAIGASKELTQFAWRIAIDVHRTLAPLQYPPHVIALGCLYLAALLSSFEQPPSASQNGALTSHGLVNKFTKDGGWLKVYHTQAEDLEEIAHTFIDLLIQVAQHPSANTSPSTPSSPSPHLPSSRSQQSLNPHPPPSPFKSDQLIRLKIQMRETEHTPRPRQPLGTADPSALYGGDNAAMLGKNEGTMRFLFGPPGVAGHV